MACVLFIKQMFLNVEIGVYPKERGKKQTIIANIDIHIDDKKAIASDDVNDSLNYHHWANAISQAVDKTAFHLLESLAQFIALHIQDFSPMTTGCCIELTKPNIIEQASACGVRIERHW